MERVASSQAVEISQPTFATDPELPDERVSSFETLQKMISPKELWPLVKESVPVWLTNRAASMGAALAYYTAFSIAPTMSGTTRGTRSALLRRWVSSQVCLLPDADPRSVRDLSPIRNPFRTAVVATAGFISARLKVLGWSATTVMALAAAAMLLLTIAKP